MVYGRAVQSLRAMWAAVKSSFSGRTCCIEIDNAGATYILDNSRIYPYSGSCITPFPPTVAPGASGTALFRKTPNTATGCVGVVTYDLMNKDTNLTAEKIAVMFSAPYNYSLYSNVYAVGVFDVSTKCDEALYNHMYYDEPTTFSRQRADGSWLSYVGDHITIMGTMTDTYEPVLKVQVSQN